MGSYTSFSVCGYEIFTDKNAVNDRIVTLFNETHFKNYIDDKGNEVIKYELDSESFTKRLEIMGYSLEKVKNDFRVNFDKDEYFEYFDGHVPFYDDYFELFSDIIEDMIRANCHHHDLYDGLVEMDELGLKGNFELYDFILNYQMESLEYEWGIPLQDSVNLIYLVLHLTNFEGCVEYEISDVIASGWVEKKNFIEESHKSLSSLYSTFGKVIIITEGVSDKLIIEKGLSFLYPNLSDLYSFYDYKAAKAQGSTSEIVRIVKSFISAGIVNRVIVFFDNDTEGHASLNELMHLNIPENIRLLTYPDLEIAKNYPTLGPNGIMNMDINGLACSIELYLGDSILIDDNDYFPIQWTGYNKKVEKYQGAIIDKKVVQKEFEEKFKSDPNNIEWVNIRKILNEMFTAFRY